MDGRVSGGSIQADSRPAAHARVVVALLSTLLTALPAIAVESWSDARLPVREGLELWLDATRVAGADAPPTDGALETWRDASGQARHVSQSRLAARPKRLAVGDAAIVRFDGLDDHLRAVDQNAALQSFTLFIVAAPRANVGAWSAILAFNAPNERDYTSGLNIDFGPAPTKTLSVLNVEGRGFQGMQNLRRSESPFDTLQTFAIASDNDAKTLQLLVDGKPEGDRARTGEAISLAEITIGARYFSAYDGKIQTNGFGRVDIAEVLLFNRRLTDQQINDVRKYLADKYAPLKNALPPADDGLGEPLDLVDNPPPVQVFVPGFSVRELPLELSNINNVKYRPDGTLVALGYDGRVWLLRDSDHDGLEDRATLFWENPIALRAAIGMDLTPPGYPRGDGLFLVGKTQCLLIVDTDHDDRADKTIEVAGGWKESFQPVDGLGVAFDPRDGGVYYGRGTYNYRDPLLRDEQGNAKYSLAEEAGAIIRVSPDFKTREIVATGIRFPVGLRINRHGELFATDQEGATWVPNGNPFDELLHIQRGRHYGFPARHPRHLPGVIDEPSTFDYSPQHQSLCGLNFNEPVVAGGPLFGPAPWADNLFLAGYSRGKLYRTQLAKSAQGYVARTQLLACLKMLLVDCCIGPTGELVVACHSGGPDWGSGPTGIGKLYKITYSDPEHPQVAIVWPSGPRELRIEFDRPIEPRLLQNVLVDSKLTAGEYVRAGDRFESLAPGYAIVQMQKASPRYDVPIRSAQLTPDRRTLVMSTDPMTRASHFALTLPGMGRRGNELSAKEPSVTGSASASDVGDIRHNHKKTPAKPVAHAPAEAELPQHIAIDLAFDQTGCEATWTPSDGSPAWNGWLPHLDLDVSRQLTIGSASHDTLWRAMRQPGELVLRAQLDLTDMLRPAVQPGSTIDYKYPPEQVTVEFTTNSPGATLTLATARGGDGVSSGAPSASVRFTAPSDSRSLVPVELRLRLRDGQPSLSAAWTTNEDDRPRPFALRRIVVPWARRNEQPAESNVALKVPELEGGSWVRGYATFFSEKAACAKCHTIYGRGGTIGPDLSNLVHRDYASVLRDISHPSFAINPDHLTYTAILRDGRVLTGVVRSTGNTTSIGAIDGNVVEVATDEIDSLAPSGISTMPEGLATALGEAALRDLLTFLLTAPPHMPRDYPGPRPKARPIAAVHQALAGAPDPAEKTRPIKLVLVAGAKDHGPGEHDYPAWQKAWSELFRAAPDVEVSTAWEWPSKEQFAEADVIVFYQHGNWTPQRAADIDPYLKRGGGLVYIHWALDGQALGGQFAKRIALAGSGAIEYRHGEITLDFNRQIDHPIIRNFEALSLVDETYWNLAGNLPSSQLLASATEDGAPRPQLWIAEPHQGRVFVSIPGHYSWTFDDPLFRILLLRGIAWAAKEPVDRFNDLVWPGADVAK